MKHENAPDPNNQDAINEHVVYLYSANKLSLTVYANSLTEQQKQISRDFLKQHLSRIKQNK